MDKTFFIDVSHWDPKVDYKLLKSEGVDVVVIKTTQGNYRTDDLFWKHYKAAKSADMVIGLYHWLDPVISTYPTSAGQRQAEYFLKILSQTDAKFYWLDVEQQWWDWKEWQAGKITKVIPPSHISQSALAFIEYVKGNSPAIPVVYTNQNFILTYAKPMLNWLAEKNVNLSLARYPFARTHTLS